MRNDNIDKLLMIINERISVGDVGLESEQGAIIRDLGLPSIIQLGLDVVPPHHIGGPGGKHSPVSFQNKRKNKAK